MSAILLPTADGDRRRHELHEPTTWRPLTEPSVSRTAYAAAHVVADPLSDTAPGAPAVLDWDATLAYRHHLWDLGLGVADAMDTAQRNFGLDWATTAELISRSGAEATARQAPMVCGITTDHVEGACSSLAEVTDAYLLQLETAESAGVTPVVMASRHLAQVANGADDYAQVYGSVLSRASRPVLLHWLGSAFDPQLEGYWGSSDIDEAMKYVLRIIEENVSAVDGIKLSLLDASHEVEMRRRLPANVKMYCGDDFYFPGLIRGDEIGYSHALLGIFDAVAPAASTALRALDEGDPDRFSAIMDETLPLSRHVFGSPTFHYKTGITFLAWLAGYQDGFVMVGGMAAARSVLHLVETFRLADELGLFPDPELTAARLRSYLETAGVGA